MSKWVKLEDYRDTLQDLYVDRLWTLKQVAEYFNRDSKLIYRWLLRLGIRVRTSGESRRLLHSQWGDKNYHWKGGYTHSQGYKVVYNDDHERVLEHRLIACVPDGLVTHHINGDPADNRPENLMIMTQSNHMKLHALLRRLGG
jgi:hypothetical protein